MRVPSTRLLLVLSVVLSIGGQTRAQQLGTKEQLDRAYSEFSPKKTRLLSGDETPDKSTKKLADGAAEYYIYRITHRTLDHVRVQKDFADHLGPAFDKKAVERKDRAFANMFGAALVEKMKDVLTSARLQNDPSTSIRAAEMLPTMARLKQVDVSNYLIALIEDSKTHDAIRVYALKAMKEAMPIQVQQELDPLGAWDLKDKAQNARRSFDAKNVDALVRFIERPIKIDNLSQDDLATMRFLRREAITSLAAAGAPAVMAFMKPAVKEGLVAPTLLKVLTKNGLATPASLAEKVEAALGLCAMEYPFMPEYQPDLAVHLVGQTLVEFINEYNKDWGNFSRVGAGKKVPYYPWKVDAKRFQAGLKDLTSNAKGRPAAAKTAAELQAKVRLLLDSMATYNQPDGARLEDLSRWVPTTRPKTGNVFKTLKIADIPLD